MKAKLTQEERVELVNLVFDDVVAILPDSVKASGYFGFRLEKLRRRRLALLGVSEDDQIGEVEIGKEAIL